MIFYLADMDLVMIVRRDLNDFAGLSWLITNLEKSHVFLSGVDDEYETFSQIFLGFRRGSLPIRYLGIPLISIKLTHTDYMPLVERIFSKIKL